MQHSLGTPVDGADAIYNRLFRWFIGLSMNDTVWVPTVFTKNRERLIAHDAVIALFNEVLAIANQNNWLSGEHFSVDGTLIQAWAGHKSFARKDVCDDDTGNFKGKSRSNDTHESTTDADARLYRKGNTASELRFMGHTLSDNRHGLIANAVVTAAADGYAEREAAKVMIADAKQVADETAEITLGADKGYDAAEFIEALADMKVVPMWHKTPVTAVQRCQTASPRSTATRSRSKSASSLNKDLAGPSSLVRFAR